MGSSWPEFARCATQLRRGGPGIGIEGWNDLKEGDILEFFTMEKVIATSLS